MKDRETVFRKLTEATNSQPDVMDIFYHANEWHTYDDRTVALILGADIERALGMIIDAKFTERSYSVEHDPTKDKSYKMGFADRIKCSVKIGAISEEARNDIEAIKNIRNAFAHTRKALSFNSPEVSDAVDTLTLMERRDLLFLEFIMPDNAGPRWKFETVCKQYCEWIEHEAGLFSLRVETDLPAIR